MHAMSTQDVRIAALNIYPIKSCRGHSVQQALLIETGFEFDRAWMLVDEHDEFVSQRELPRMTLVRSQLRHDDLLLRAPGMLALHLSLDAVEAPCRVRVWDDEVHAFDMGTLAAQWFSDFLGRTLRLVRFDPAHKRLADRRWTGTIDAETAFADGFPLLVTSTASLAALNARLAQPVTMERLRPNLVLDGLDEHGEDFIDELRFDTADGPVRLKLVKPCSRCTIPNVDPDTGESDVQVSDALQSYRCDARLNGAVTFGMNAVIVEGVDRVLTVGQRGQGTIAFG
jgi:uncharacterized protein